MRFTLTPLIMATAITLSMIAVAFAQEERPSATGSATSAENASTGVATDPAIPRGGEPLWYPLEGGGSALFATRTPEDPFKPADYDQFITGIFRKDAAALPFRERWLQQTIKERFPPVVAVHVVEYATTRYALGRRTTEVRRGLEVIGPSECLERVKSWLDRFAQLRATQIQAEFHIVRSSPRDSGPGRIRAEVQLLTRAAYQEHLAEAQQHATCEVTALPTILVLNGQRAVVSRLERTRYLGDYDTPVLDGAVIPVPVIKTVHDGVLLAMTPVIHPAGDRVTVKAKVAVTVLRRPIRKMTIKADTIKLEIERKTGKPTLATIPARELSVQLPELIRTGWESNGLEISPESWFVVKQFGTVKDEAFDKHTPLRIYAHVKVLKPNGRKSAATGQVIGIDAGARRAFVRWPEIENSMPTDSAELEVWRAGRRVGALKVIEHAGRVSICELPETPPNIRTGDLVKR